MMKNKIDLRKQAGGIESAKYLWTRFTQALQMFDNSDKYWREGHFNEKSRRDDLFSRYQDLRNHIDTLIFFVGKDTAVKILGIHDTNPLWQKEFGNR